MKTQDRQNHGWSEPDEYGIYTCKFCGTLMRKVANVFSMNLRQVSGQKWVVKYSKKGTKWTDEHLPCERDELESKVEKLECKTDSLEHMIKLNTSNYTVIILYIAITIYLCVGSCILCYGLAVDDDLFQTGKVIRSGVVGVLTILFGTLLYLCIVIEESLKLMFESLKSSRVDNSKEN